MIIRSSERIVGKRETRDVEVRLRRAIDMAALGWYSGDPHLHMERTGSNVGASDFPPTCELASEKSYAQRMKELREEVRRFGENGRSSLPLPKIETR
jgi:hypothetical protein